MAFLIWIGVLTLLCLPITKSEVAVTWQNGKGDPIPRGPGKLTLWYNSTNTYVATYVIDFCQISACQTSSAGTNMPWTCSYVAQQPMKYGHAYICVTDNYWGHSCSNWGAVGWNTRADQPSPEEDWGYRPLSAQQKRDKNGKSLLTRMSILKRGLCNSLFIINIENPSPGDEGTYMLGSYVRGEYGPAMGRFHLKDMSKSIAEWNKASPTQPLNPKVLPATNPLRPHIQTFGSMMTIENPTYEDTLAAETGFSDVNLWLEWMRYSANAHNKTNCYVCGAARPHLGTVPLNIPEKVEGCFLSLFTNTTTNNSVCEDWKTRYPLLTKTPKPGEGMQIYPGNYTCYNSTSGKGRNLGELGPEYCSNYSTIDSSKLQNMTQSLGDVYWICGDGKIRSRMTGEWRGECALAKAIMGLHILQKNSGDKLVPETRRRKREVKGSLDPHVYIDAIGVPRGVPDEFKARDQVAAGFESLIPIITVNKNVDWINYIYYNQQRFVNYTRDALQGIAEQLQADSAMTFQNRMALDMILAEKGGVCKMIPKTGSCCTYIPDNVGPNGKTTEALQKLTDLSEELKANSGIDNPWDQYFGWIKGWKQALVQLGIIIIVALGVGAFITCCAIPLGRKICVKGVTETTTTMYEQTISTEHDYTQYLLKHKEKKRQALKDKNHFV